MHYKRWNNERKKQRGIEMLARRRVDIRCVQEKQYKGEGCTVFGEGEEGYNFLWIGEKDKRG